MWDTIVTMEEVNHPHPCWPACNMFVLWEVLNCSHFATALCARGTDQKRRKLVEEDTREGASTVLQVYGKKLETVNSFKYLRCLLTSM